MSSEWRVTDNNGRWELFPTRQAALENILETYDTEDIKKLEPAVCEVFGVTVEMAKTRIYFDGVVVMEE